jgi:hypothetical protein
VVSNRKGPAEAGHYKRFELESLRDLAKPVSLKEREVKQIDLVVKPLRSQ